jgi:hypothetical protein
MKSVTGPFTVLIRVGRRRRVTARPDPAVIPDALRRLPRALNERAQLAVRFLRSSAAVRLLGPLCALVVLLALVQTAPACDCPPTVTNVDDGVSAAGIVPSAVVAPWIGDHPGQLTWLFSGRTTPLHFDVARSSGFISESTLEFSP